MIIMDLLHLDSAESIASYAIGQNVAYLWTTSTNDATSLAIARGVQNVFAMMRNVISCTEKRCLAYARKGGKLREYARR